MESKITLLNLDASLETPFLDRAAVPGGRVGLSHPGPAGFMDRFGSATALPQFQGTSQRSCNSLVLKHIQLGRRGVEQCSVCAHTPRIKPIPAVKIGSSIFSSIWLT